MLTIQHKIIVEAMRIAEQNVVYVLEEVLEGKRPIAELATFFDRYWKWYNNATNESDKTIFGVYCMTGEDVQKMLINNATPYEKLVAYAYNVKLVVLEESDEKRIDYMINSFLTPEEKKLIYNKFGFETNEEEIKEENSDDEIKAVINKIRYYIATDVTAAYSMRYLKHKRTDFDISLYEIPIKDTTLKKRTKSVLRMYGITNVGILCEYSLSRLLSVPYIGKVTMFEIIDFLKKEYNFIMQ